MIVDCHIHLAQPLSGFWQPLRYGLVRDRGHIMQAMPPAFDPPACPPELALAYMDQAAVDMAIIVQHHLYGDQNALVTDAVRRWPDRFAGFAYLGRMDQPDDPDRLERLLAGGLAGLKVELGTTRRLRPDFRFDDEHAWALWERLDGLGRPLILDINEGEPADVAALRKVFAAFPRLRTCICHVGGAPREGWEERALLAQHPQVYLDLASLQAPYGPDHEYPYSQEQALIRWAAEQVGAHKLMWGTDSPGALNLSTYRQLIDVVRRHCGFLGDADKEAVLGGTALRFLRGAG